MEGSTLAPRDITLVITNIPEGLESDGIEIPFEVALETGGAIGAAKEGECLIGFFLKLPRFLKRLARLVRCVDVVEVPELAEIVLFYDVVFGFGMLHYLNY